MVIAAAVVKVWDRCGFIFSKFVQIFSPWILDVAFAVISWSLTS